MGQRPRLLVVCVLGALLAPGPQAVAATHPPALAHFGYYDSGFRAEDLQAVAPYTNFAFTYLDRVPMVAQHGLKSVVYLANLAKLQRQYADGEGNIHYGSDLARFKREFRAHVPRIKELIDPNGDGSTDDSSILAFYLHDEPIWNGIDNAALAAAAKFVKRQLRDKSPAIPLLLVEAVPGLGEQTDCPKPNDARKQMKLKVPNSQPPAYVASTECTEPLKIPAAVDWVAFDAYGVPNPDTDLIYRATLDRLKARRVAPDQKLFLVMDAWWHPWEHGNRGVAVEEMAEYAHNYYELAQSEPDVVGIAAWVWDAHSYGPQDDPRGPTIGTKDFPLNVRAEHMRIGARIAGRPVAFPPTNVRAVPDVPQSIPNGSWTRVAFGNERVDDAAEWTSEDSELEPGSAATLTVAVSVKVRNASANGDYRLAIVKNGRRVAVERVVAPATGPLVVTLERDVTVAPGDRVHIAFRNFAPNAVTIAANRSQFRVACQASLASANCSSADAMS